MSFVSASQMNFVPKTWGYEVWIVNNEKYCGKILFIKKGRFCSYHYHEKKDEVLYVQSGRIWFTYDDSAGEKALEYRQLFEGEAFHVPPGLRHQMQAIEDTHIFEISTQHFDEDSIRITKDLVLSHSCEEDLK